MKSARIMFGYAAFLVICGLIAFFMAPPDAKATTALLVPCIAAGLMVVFASMASAFYRNRVVGMVGIHVGMALPILFAGAFGYRAYNTFTSGVEEKQYLAIILSVMAIGSVLAFIAILLTRPPKVMRGAAP